MTTRAGTGLSEAVRIVRVVATTPLHYGDGRCVWCDTKNAGEDCEAHKVRCTYRRACLWMRHRDAMTDR